MHDASPPSTTCVGAAGGAQAAVAERRESLPSDGTNTVSENAHSSVPPTFADAPPSRAITFAGRPSQRGLRTSAHAAGGGTGMRGADEGAWNACPIQVAGRV